MGKTKYDEIDVIFNRLNKHHIIWVATVRECRIYAFTVDAVPDCDHTNIPQINYLMDFVVSLFIYWEIVHDFHNMNDEW